MEFKLFKSAEMVALKQKQKWSLFSYVEDDKTGRPRLIPLKFAQDTNILEVNEQYHLVVTSDKVYSFSGKELCEHSGDAKIVSAGIVCLIVFASSTKRLYNLNLIIWDGKKKLFNTACTDYRCAFGRLAVCYGSIWSLYSVDGNLLEDGAFQAVDVELYRDLLVAKRVGDNALYSFAKGEFIKEHQVIIYCSRSCNLALCAEIGNNSLNVYSNGKWHELPVTEDFGILEGMDSLFYIKRDGKYFLYEDDMTRFMQHLYPDGVDFVACDKDRVLLIVNNGEPQFYNQEI